MKVVIAAQDSPGLPNKKIGRTILMIHITDVNDNSPRIDVNIIIKGPDDAGWNYIQSSSYTISVA